MPVSAGGPVPDSPLPKINESSGDTPQELANGSPNPDQGNTILQRIFFALEPKGCLKERDEYSLYIFPPHNRYITHGNYYPSI